MSSTCTSSARRFALLAAASTVLPRWAAAAATSAAPLPELASAYRDQIDVARCLVSEKYDGVRALWDGRTLRHRSGRVVAAPASFLEALPREPLDGELWLGRGRFDALSAIVRRLVPDAVAWSSVRYMVFDQPVAAVAFDERLARLAAILPRGGAPAELAPQWRVGSRAALERELARIVAGGGEGVVLHVASAPHVAGRSDAVFKLKPALDAEARVVGHRRGSGRYGGQLGALEVETEDGRRFFLGSGLSDAERRDPPPIGSQVTYRYRDLTSNGLPRFATFVRRHEEW